MREPDIVEAELVEIGAMADDEMKLNSIIVWCATHPMRSRSRSTCSWAASPWGAEALKQPLPGHCPQHRFYDPRSGNLRITLVSPGAILTDVRSPGHVPLFSAPLAYVLRTEPRRLRSRRLKSMIRALRPRTGFSPPQARLRATNTTLQQLIQAAYSHRHGSGRSALPAWMESDRFDIDAGRRELQFRGGFADKLQRAARRPVPTSIPPRGAPTSARKSSWWQRVVPSFSASKDQDQKEHANIRATEISGVAIPFGHFVSILAAQLGYPITNQTRLSGKYDLAVKIHSRRSVGRRRPYRSSPRWKIWD